jgi:hypothetical protein
MEHSSLNYAQWQLANDKDRYLGRHTTVGQLKNGFREYTEDVKYIEDSTLWPYIEGVVYAVICIKMNAKQCLLYFNQ